MGTLQNILLLTLATALLPGCFILVDDDDDDDDRVDPPTVVNYEPTIDGDGTWWFCDYSESADDYFFEFQAVVDDFDGDWDVGYVDVTVYEAGTEWEIDAFTLVHEEDTMWGGLVWERESELYCGDPIDVVFEAWDWDGGYDRLTLWY